MARTGPYPPAPRLEHPGIRVAAVVAGFHRDLERAPPGRCPRAPPGGGAARGQLEDHWVPGAFELPLAARAMAHRRRYAAVIAIGVVIRGRDGALRPHLQRHRQRADDGQSRDRGPVHLRGADLENREQAEARSGGDKGNAGVDAADAAIVMVNLLADSR